MDKIGAVQIGVVVCGLVVLVALALRRKLRFRFGDKEVSVGEGEGSCGLCVSRVETIVKRRVKGVYEMRSELVDAQMKYATNVLDGLVQSLAESYLEFVADVKGFGHGKGSVSYCLYKSKVELFVLTCALPGLRQMFVENHIAEMDAMAWAKHRDHVADAIIADISDFCDSHFVPADNVPRERFDCHHAIMLPLIRGRFQEIMDYGRGMALITQQRVNTLKASSRDALNSIGRV